MGACLKTGAQAGQIVLSNKDSRAASSRTSNRAEVQQGNDMPKGTARPGMQVLSDMALRKLVRGDLVRNFMRGNNEMQSTDSQGSHSFIRRGGKGQRQNARSVRFGCDVVVAPEALPDRPCGICFTPAGDLSSPAKRWCGNAECKDAYCTECLGHYASGKVLDALHFAPPIPCPGAACRRRIPTAVWSQAVEPEVRARYHSNASALLAIRCPTCDEVRSLLREPRANANADEEQLLRGGSGSTEGLREEWLAFSRGEAPPDAVLGWLLRGSGGRVGQEGEPPACVRRVLDLAASLVQDEERRVCLQLATLRRFPKIRTPCCSAKMCFKCKVAGWHPRVTCEARQRKFVESSQGVQCCPSCGIPTQRTEGCLQMDCVCGKSWQWEHTEEEIRDRERSFTPLPLVYLGIPGQLDMEFLRSLVSRRADLTAVRQSDRWSAAHFASASGTGEGRWAVDALRQGSTNAPHSDASRLEALIQVQEESGLALDLDAQDSDGDTPLSVAAAGGNTSAARLLVTRGALMRRQVFESLQWHTPAPDRLEMREVLRPLLAKPGSLDDGAAGLPLWLEFGDREKAEEAAAALEPGESVEDGVAAAFVWGRWLGTASSSSSGNDTSVDLKLAQVYGAEEWATGKRNAAARMLWTTLESGWPHRRVEVEALRAAVAAGASLGTRREDDDDDEDNLLLGEALERQEPEAVEFLLSAGAELFALDREDGALGSNFTRALELLSPARAEPIAKVLAPRLEEAAAKGRELPLWLCMQLGLAARTKQMLEAGAEVGAEELVGAMKRALLNAHQGVAEPNSPLDALKARCPQERWKSMLADASTALLHIELHQAHNFERDPDLKLCRRLLADFGADASTLSGSLRPEFAELAKVSSSGENLTPLMLLAVNCYSSTESAKEAAELLLEHKADPNQPDEDGDTALFWALLQQHAPVAEALARAGGALVDGAVDRLQVWSHPGSLRPLATALAPQLREKPLGASESEGWPAWLQVQFGLPGAQRGVDEAIRASSDEDDSESLREVVEALLLADFCGGTKTAAESSLLSLLGEELYTGLRRDAANLLLSREMVGAFEGKWQLDTAWVKKLLDAGADVNLLLDLGDGSDAGEDWGDAEDSLNQHSETSDDSDTDLDTSDS